MIKISPSILSADILNLGRDIAAIEQAGADWVHIDVMDGHYVPNITYGPALVKAVKSMTKLPLDVHLMIKPAQPNIKAFAEAGADIITIHPDADIHTHRVLSEIKSYGAKAGIALNPGTPVTVLEPLIPFVDLVLVMSVNPGFGGQSYIPEVTHKITQVRQMIDRSGRAIDLEVDGGINLSTAQEAVAAGATTLVAGAAIFGQPADQYRTLISGLRGSN